MRRLGSTVEEFFNIKVDIKSKDKCWPWKGYLSGGYGCEPACYWFKQYKVNRAHQLSYILYHGEYDRSLVISHLCHNKACVNPDHLLACSQGENIAHEVFNKDETTRYINIDTIENIFKDVGFLTNGQIRKKYNIKKETLRNLINGKTYGLITNIEKPLKNTGNTISMYDIDKIFAMRSFGDKLIVIANEIGCSESMVCRILKGNRRQNLSSK